MSHCNDVNFTCSDLTSPCENPKHIDFDSLWEITTKYAKVCPQGAWLAPLGRTNESLALSRAAAYSIVGPGYTTYPKADIWTRLTAWKFPLVTLVALFPRPPLSVATQGLTMLHLTSDPIDTIEDLLYKLDSCQYQVILWQQKIDPRGKPLRTTPNDLAAWHKRQQRCRNLAIILESYKELGPTLSEDAEAVLR